MDEREHLFFLKKWYRIFRASYFFAAIRNPALLLSSYSLWEYFFVRTAGTKGRGLFTRKKIPQQALAFIVKGSTRFFRAKNESEYFLHPNWFAVDKDTWIDPAEPYVFLNHSCNPNLGINDRREFIALRDILPGEELTFDYSITEDEVGWYMNCACGEVNCRKVIRSIQFLPTNVFTERLPYIPHYFQSVYAKQPGGLLKLRPKEP